MLQYLYIFGTVRPAIANVILLFYLTFSHIQLIYPFPILLLSLRLTLAPLSQLILLPSSLFPFALSIPESYIFSRRRDQGAVVSPSRSRPPLSRRLIKAAVDLACRCLVVQIEARSRPPSSSPAVVSPSRARRDRGRLQARLPLSRRPERGEIEAADDLACRCIVVQIEAAVVLPLFLLLSFSADFGGMDSFPLSWDTGVAYLGEVKDKSIKVAWTSLVCVYQRANATLVAEIVIVNFLY
ncbi:hypothetical protein SO802_024216 [Lithocarpus litseifolius]|uniref:Uncharacterized protein n=1 Tax=Lithocarpus litseifolius TaxID=425828 RepID=A0AAW2C9Y5_9ROSI